MPTMLIVIPETVMAQYEIRVHHVQELDHSGEFCEFCAREDTYVDLQWYGTPLPEFATATCLDQAFGTCCVDCLEDVLRNAGIDPSHTVTVEVER